MLSPPFFLALVFQWDCSAKIYLKNPFGGFANTVLKYLGNSPQDAISVNYTPFAESGYSTLNEPPFKHYTPFLTKYLKQW